MGFYLRWNIDFMTFCQHSRIFWLQETTVYCNSHGVNGRRKEKVLSCCSPNYSHWFNQFSACICSEKHLLLVGDGGWREWEIAIFLLVRCKTKQNEMKDSKYWKRHDKWGPLSTRGGVKRQGGRGEGYETLVWISKPFISRIEEEITSRLVFYHYIYAFRCRFGSFKPSLYNLLPFQLSYVMFSVFLCHVVL